MPQKPPKTDESQSISCLLPALKEAQDSVRSYDAKAQIVGVGFIFTIGILTKLGAHLPGGEQFETLGVIFFWVLVIGPIIMFGFVLYPSRNVASHLESYEEAIRHNYYFSGKRQRILMGIPDGKPFEQHGLIDTALQLARNGHWLFILSPESALPAPLESQAQICHLAANSLHWRGAGVWKLLLNRKKPFHLVISYDRKWSNWLKTLAWSYPAQILDHPSAKEIQTACQK